MAFVNKYSSIIRRSNKSIVNIYEDEKIFFNFYDENNNLIKSKTLSKNIDLSTLHFSLTKNDEIIGLYDDNSLKMIKIDKNDDITNQVVINYDSNQFKTIFPYIEKIDDEVHIFYYGYSVPDDVSVAGFSDVKIARIYRPKLTTVHQPLYDIGAVAIRMVIKLINNESLDEKKVELPYRIIERESVKSRN